MHMKNSTQVKQQMNITQHMHAFYTKYSDDDDDDRYFIDPRREIQVSSRNIKTDNKACIKSINIKYKNKKYKQSTKKISNSCPSRKSISNSPVQVLFTGKICKAV